MMTQVDSRGYPKNARDNGAKALIPSMDSEISQKPEVIWVGAMELQDLARPRAQEWY